MSETKLSCPDCGVDCERGSLHSCPGRRETVRVPLHGGAAVTDAVKPYMTLEELDACVRFVCDQMNQIASSKSNAWNARANVNAALDRLLATAKAGLADTERLDWLESKNAQIRGESPILPPSCGFSVRKYIDHHVIGERTPTSSGRAPSGGSE